MKDSFTIDELREFFENNVMNSDRHGNSYYTTLYGEIHSTDVGYFIECMPYFLQDLQYHLDEINKPELDRIKAICSYKTPIEALNNLYKHIDRSYIRSLKVVKFPDNGKGVLFDYYGSILKLTPATGTDFDKEFPEADWTHSESYHVQYDDKNCELTFFVDIGENSKLSNR